ncbi:helix-turn-helix transcriptional regulator [Subdoligranulum sp. DSM 109015]|uniref:Helix-turn-helix transcriptional regulator n=2 Tax=Gemmiger gallinarum TaxID=2779354 RepID=A0ABR9QZW5_9FIRM|nr:helix-turn-helix transcriptional regulator [Gemmiger gallinarum]
MNMDCGYSPELDFYIEKIDRNNAYEMATFHTHHKYEIYYEIEGTRRYFIEDAAYVVNAGSVVLIGENQIHKTGTIGDGPSSRIAIIFRPEYLQEICNSFADVDFFDFLGKRGNHLLNSISVKQQNRIFAMMQQMMSLQGEEGQDVKAANKMMLATLLLYLKHLCQMQRERGGDSGRVSNRIIDQIQSYISLHYAEKLTLTGIAEKFYISPYYLSRLFKKTINLSLVEYINGIRIKAAQSLIEKTDDSIADVAGKTGFMTTAHFRRVFKDATGFSPQQYRQFYRKISKSEG